MKKRILSVFLSLLTILFILPTFHFSAEAADYSAELRKQGFPESYISSLNKLKQAHPKWNFEVLKVNENFSTSVSQERKSHSQQLIQQIKANDGKGYYCSCSKCSNNGTPKVMEPPNWVSASEKAVEYYLDPRNFLDEQHIFQFESIFYNESQTQEGVESILKGTWMHDANITYKDKSGNNITYKKDSKTVKYSQAIMDASKYSGLSAYYLASKIVQEVGGAKPSAGGASGTYTGYEGIYNYYNIAAYTGAADGLKWASFTPQGAHVQTSKGGPVNLRSQPTTNSSIVASIPSGTSIKTYEYTKKQSDGYWVKLTNISVGGNTHTGYIHSDYFVESAKDTYNRPWTNPYLSIYNGAKWIANNFSQQYTGYLQKFNVNPASKYMHSNEYMANVQAAASEAAKTYTAYKSAGALDDAITFSIPVFNNMSITSLSEPTLNAVKVNANGSFTLSWNAVEGADKYEIYLLGTNGSYSLMTTVSTTSYTTVVAQYGKQYSYKVRAIDSKNNIHSDLSSVVTAVNNKKLQTPALKAAINSNGTFTLSWNTITGADKYEIYLLGANETYSLMKTVSSSSYTTVVAQYGKQYTYKVRAVNSQNSSAASDFSSVVSATNDKALQIPALKAVANSNGTFTLSWNAVTGADQYEIYLLGANGAYSLMKTVSATSYTTVVAQYSKQYSYKLKAVNSKNNITSDFSNVVSAANTTKIPAPKFNPAKVNDNGSFTLSWNSVSGTDKYEIYLLGADGTYNLMKTVTSTSYTTVVAQYGKQYSYKVRAVDSKNNMYSDFSNIVSASNTVKFSKPAFDPANVNDNGSFTLSWSSVSGADKYEIHLLGADGTYSLMKTVASTSYTTVVAQYGKQYSYKVRAVDSKNNTYSDFSNVVSAINTVKLPAPKFNPAKVNDNGSFTLSWSSVSGADKYEIYLLGTDGAYSLMKTVSTTSYTTVIAQYGKQYSYKLKAVDSKNSSVASDFSSVVSATNDQRLQKPTLKAAINSNGTFSLSWNTVTGADKYEIYLLGANGTYSLMKTVSATSYTTVVAQYGKKYSYKLKAVDSKNSSAASDFSSVVSATNDQKLQTPTLKAATNSNGTFTLSWNAVTGADKYEIHLLGADGAYSLMKTVSTTSYTTVVARYCKQYSYKLKAVNSKNDVYSEFSNIVSAVNDKIMAAPKLNEIKVNSNGTFTLSWNTVIGADKYEIYVCNNGTGKYQLNGTVTQTSATTGYAPYSAKYSYKIRALDSKNNVSSEFSNIRSATNNIKLSALELKPIEVNTNGSFTLSWNAVYGANGYEIYIKNSDGTYSLVKTTADTSFTTSVAEYGKPYSYRARAVDSKNKIYSEFSNIVSAVNNKKLQTPSNANLTVNSNASFTLSWNIVTGATSYEIYIKNTDGSYKLLKTVTTNTTTLYNAQKGKQYTYKIRAIDTKNEAAASDYTKELYGLYKG